MKIKGTAIAPGVSRNGRYYSPEMISAAVEHAQPRVRAGQLLMKSHHGAQDTLGVVGKLTSLRVAEDGSAQFEAELADTTAARDVGALIRGPKPFVNGVSIVGEWTGPVRRVKVQGQTAETSSGLSLHSVDFTATPGIDAARIVAESLQGTRIIFEAAAGPVEPADPEPTPREFAQMTSEEFDRASGQLWAGTFATWDQRRHAEGSSPFWRGMTAD